MSAVILIVDDDPLLCRLYETTLQKHGFQTYVALSGATALEYLEHGPVDLMLLDIMMADMDGFDVIRRIRHHPVHRALPILIVTARPDAATRRRGLSEGANDWLTKPVTSEDVVSHIQAMLSQE